MILQLFVNVSHSDVKNGKLPGIESDPARVPGVEKCRKRSLLPTYSNGPSRLVGIQWAFKWTRGTFIFKLHWVVSAIQFVGCFRLRTLWSGKMSDPGRTQPTHVGIQTDPGPLFSTFTGSVPHNSSIQFSVVLSYQKHSLRNELRMN